MLSEALQRKAKHVAGLSNISGHCLRVAAQKHPTFFASLRATHWMIDKNS
jgi:hypothetical protein